jgi:hypothetical protein
VAVHPLTQIVLRIFSWVTAGFISPGVSLVFGRPELSEYGAAAQAERANVAESASVLTMTNERFELLLRIVVSQRLKLWLPLLCNLKPFFPFCVMDTCNRTRLQL